MSACAHVTRRGKQCTHSALAGETLCQRHMPDRVVLTSTDPEDLLRALMQSSDKRVQLRAVVAYTNLIKDKRRVCKACADRAEVDKDREDWFRRLTAEQKVEIMSTIARMNAIKDAARLQPVNTETL